MEVYIVGIIKKRKKIDGFQLLNADHSNVETRLVSYDQLYAAMRYKGLNVKNAKIDGSSIKGIGGSLERYGVVGSSNAIVILRQIYRAGKAIGFLCSDCMGNLKKLETPMVIDFANKIGIANGKLVTNSDGSQYISPIEGTFEVWDLGTPSNKTVAPKTEVKAEVKKEADTEHETTGIENKSLDNVPDDVKALIEKLKTFEEYKDSFSKQIVATIESKHKCSNKQVFYLKKDLEKWTKKHLADNAGKVEDKNNTPKNTDEHVKENKDTNIEKDNTTSDKNDSNLSKENVVLKSNKTIDNGLLTFMKMNGGRVYVSGFRADVVGITADTEKDLVIPSSTIIDGVTYPVSGISIGAFSGTLITSVEIPASILDIGHSAFENCPKLLSVDMSAAKNHHIPMNCFRGDYNLISVKLGNNVERIHESAFSRCSHLSYIDIPDSVETIAREAFAQCVRLEEVNTKAKSINESVFYGCLRLNKFDFGYVTSIGTTAFFGTAFEEITIPSNVVSIGTSAFRACPKLTKVTIEEGVETIGNNCFDKRNTDAIKLHSGETLKMTGNIKEIHAPKSLKSIGNNAFRGAELVYGYTGSIAESHCLGFRVPFESYDNINKDNSSKVRIKSEVLGGDPIALLYKELEKRIDGESNPEYTMNEAKLVDVEMPDNFFDLLKLEKTTDVIEPKIKFKAIVNLLQDTGDFYALPLSPKVIVRMHDMLYVETDEISNDGCNRIYKVKYSIKDSLESGSYYLVLMNNHIRFVTHCTEFNDIETRNYEPDNERIFAEPFVHVGDIIGDVGNISGRKAEFIPEGQFRRVNVAGMLLERYRNHGIQINSNRNDCYMYEPAADRVLKLHFSTKDNTKKIANILALETYEDFIKNKDERIKKNNLKNDKQFFDDLATVSDNKLKHLLYDLSYIEEEKEAQLFQLAKQFGKYHSDTDVMTPEMFKELSRSYWMISKDTTWLRQAGTKSLSATREYKIGKYKLKEFKSNQVVKFSNPYMNGMKGAYVFTLNSGSSIVGVYASKYSMQDIAFKLASLANIPEDAEIIDLMKDPNRLDRVDGRLFYHFYDVLYSASGWSAKNSLRSAIWSLASLSCEFHISMYKPTGIFYLTMEKYERVEDKTKDKEKEKEKRYTMKRVVLPILPIGNMDRALMVATTTNSKFKESSLVDDLMALYIIESKESLGLGNTGLSIERYLKSDKYKGFYEARRLAIEGEHDASKYVGLVNDRILYMMGTVHKGKIQREFESGVEKDYEEDFPEIEDETFDDEDEAGYTEVETTEEYDDDIVSEEEFMDDDEDDEELLAELEAEFMDDDDEDYEDYDEE